jgi:hypothetical protein
MEKTPSSPESARPRRMTLEEAREAKMDIRAAIGVDDTLSELGLHVGILPIEYGNVVSISAKTDADAADVQDFVDEHFSNVPVKIQVIGSTQAR